MKDKIWNSLIQVIIAVCGGIVRLLLGCIHRVSLKRAG